MKKIILLLFYLSTYSLAFTQEFADTSKRGSTIDDYEYLLSEGESNPETYYTKIGSDTVIEEHNYQKILVSHDFELINWELHGFIREDTTDKRTYFRNLNNEEGCVYDFSVNPGDTLSHLYNPLRDYLFYDDFDLIVDSIYFMTVNDSIYRAMDLMQPGYPGTKERIIEGMGSECGILEVGHAFSGIVGWSLHVLCYWENDSLLYHYPEYDFCFFDDTTNNIDKTKDNNVTKVYPNPTHKEIKIDNDNLYEVSLIQIYNCLGNLVLTTKERTIDLLQHNLKRGIYYIKITDNQKKYIVEKIVLL